MFDSVVGHAFSEGGYTESDVHGGGTVLILAGSPEAFER
jgi:hypothetical protein